MVRFFLSNSLICLQSQTLKTLQPANQIRYEQKRVQLETMEGAFHVTMWVKKTSNDHEQNNDHTEYVTLEHATGDSVPTLDLSDTKQLDDFKQYGCKFQPDTQQRRRCSGCDGLTNVIQSNSEGAVDEGRTIGMFFFTILKHILFHRAKFGECRL